MTHFELDPAMFAVCPVLDQFVQTRQATASIGSPRT